MGLFFAATVPVVFAAGLSVPRLSNRWGAARMIQVGIVLAMIGGLTIWMASARYPSSLTAFTFALCVFLLGMGIANPLSTALALSPFGAQAGAASTMLGFIQMSGAALGAMLVNTVGGVSHMAAVGLLISVFQVIAFFAFGTQRRTVAHPGLRAQQDADSRTLDATPEAGCPISERSCRINVRLRPHSIDALWPAGDGGDRGAAGRTRPISATRTLRCRRLKVIANRSFPR